MKITRDVQMAFYQTFSLQNRIHTLADKIEPDLTMKQWLLITTIAESPLQLNLTELAKLMGCSRQNIKKLANPLIEKNYLQSSLSDNNQVILEINNIEILDTSEKNRNKIQMLKTLFKEFTTEDVKLYLEMQSKLEKGIEALEKDENE